MGEWEKHTIDMELTKFDQSGGLKERKEKILKKNTNFVF